MNKNRWTIVAFAVLLGLLLVPLLWLAHAGYPAAPGGGGGGSAFSITAQNASPTQCGAICGGIIAWLISKAGDYIIEQGNQPANCGECVPAGGAGGGGGAFQDGTPDTGMSTPQARKG